MTPLTIAQAASRLGVHTDTVRNMIARGDLTAVHVGVSHAKRRTLRIMSDELESFVRSRSQSDKAKQQKRISARRQAYREMAGIRS